MARNDDEPDMSLPSEVTDVAVMFPSRYLKKEDLGGEDLDITISKVVRRQVRMTSGAKETKNVIHMSGLPRHLEGKVWIVGKTVGNQIADATRERNPHKWPGLRVTIYHDKGVMFGPERKGGIRVRAQAPAAPKPSQRAGSSDGAYIHQHPDQALVADLRREMFGAKKPLDPPDVAALAAALRKQTPPAREPGIEDPEDLTPFE